MHLVQKTPFSGLQENGHRLGVMSRWTGRCSQPIQTLAAACEHSHDARHAVREEIS